MFKLLCFSAQVCFNDVANCNPHSIVLASGTLSPMSLVEQELGIEIATKQEFPHVIKPNQVSVNIVKKFEDQALNFVYANRNNVEMIR